MISIFYSNLTNCLNCNSNKLYDKYTFVKFCQTCHVRYIKSIAIYGQGELQSIMYSKSLKTLQYKEFVKMNLSFGGIITDLDLEFKDIESLDDIKYNIALVKRYEALESFE